jgi:hypothetical protein
MDRLAKNLSKPSKACRTYTFKFDVKFAVCG